MLIRHGRAARLVMFVTGAFAALTLTFGAAVAPPAHADPGDPDCWVDDPKNPGDRIYICGNDGDEGDPGDNDGNEGNEPSCDLSMIDEKGIHDGAQRWCEGENACWANIPALTEDGEDADTSPPSDKAVWIYKVCYTPDGDETAGSGWQWYEPAQPTPEQMAEIAYGRLSTPEFTLAFNPPGRSYVDLPTWWWAEGAGDGNIVGSAALGVVAIGEPDHIEVQPGDPGGPETITCDWATTKSDTCTYSYAVASSGQDATAADGSPGYFAQGRIVYTVHFEQNGEPFDVPGLTDTAFPSGWETVTVPVAEVQGIVTD